jgi:hypothetical protein
LEIHDSRNTAWSGFRFSSAIHSVFTQKSVTAVHFLNQFIEGEAGTILLCNQTLLKVW